MYVDMIFMVCYEKGRSKSLDVEMEIINKVRINDISNLKEPIPIRQQREDKHQLSKCHVVVAGILISVLEVSTRVVAYQKFNISEHKQLACQLVT